MDWGNRDKAFRHSLTVLSVQMVEKVLITVVVLFCLFVASRTACLGEEAAFFSRPFEARPADPVRREVFRQAGPGTPGAWFAPEAVLQHTPPRLAAGREPSQGPVPRVKRRRR